MKDAGLKQSEGEDVVPSEGTRTLLCLFLRGVSPCEGRCTFVPSSWSEGFIMELPLSLGMDRRERRVLLAVF